MLSTIMEDIEDDCPYDDARESEFCTFIVGQADATITFTHYDCASLILSSRRVQGTIRTLSPENKLAIIFKCGYALQFAPEFRGNRDVVICAMKTCPHAIKWADTSLTNCKIFMKDAVSLRPESLKYASPFVQADLDIVRVAVETNEMAAVSKNGLALEYASEQCQNNPDIVMAAVSNNGLALEYASERCQDDIEIVSAAVLKTGLALEYASEGVLSLFAIL